MEIGAVAGIIGGFDAAAPLTITLSAPPGVASRQPAQSGVVLSCYGHARPSPVSLITRRVHVSRQSVRFAPSDRVRGVRKPPPSHSIDVDTVGWNGF